MDLQNLVEKITREVMDTMKKKDAPEAPGGTSSPRPAQGTGNALLLAGSPLVNPELVREAVSYLKTKNFSVTAAVNRDASMGGLPAQAVQCGRISDCAGALRNAQVVVLLICSVDVLSRMANLLTDRFDVEAVLSAIESGKEVWALNAIRKIPPGLQAKADSLLREIEKFGIKVTPLTFTGTSSPSPEKTAPSGGCSQSQGSECAGCGLCASLAADKVQGVVDKGAERVSAAPGVTSINRELAAMIDHTLLKPDATKDQVLTLCREAREYSFASCCVNPTWVPTVAECLKGSPVKTCVVIGFPLGANSTMVKAMETRDAVAAGADEVDMVINVGALKAGDYDMVRRDIEAVVEAAQGRIVKVIFETALLTDEEKIQACHLSKQAGADFVKTSTGFGPGGATAHDIELMRKTVGKYMGVKASGGIRDLAKAQEMVKAGANRIGASASVAIVKGAAAQAGKGY